MRLRLVLLALVCVFLGPRLERPASWIVIAVLVVESHCRKRHLDDDLRHSAWNRDLASVFPVVAEKVLARDWNTRTFNIRRQTEVGRLDKAKSCTGPMRKPLGFAVRLRKPNQPSPLPRRTDSPQAIARKALDSGATTQEIRNKRREIRFLDRQALRRVRSGPGPRTTPRTTKKFIEPSRRRQLLAARS